MVRDQGMDLIEELGQFLDFVDHNPRTFFEGFYLKTQLFGIPHELEKRVGTEQIEPFGARKGFFEPSRFSGPAGAE
jgi:hypothetical protein